VDLTELFRTDEPEGKSVRDLMRESGLTEHQVRHKLRPMIERGEVEMAGHRQEQRIMDGRTCQIPVYRLADKQDNL
jgi:predicted ArsR family transcriptional regulator